MALALRAAGVPAKQLIYDRLLHNDLVLDWPVTARAGAGDVAASAGGTLSSQAGEAASGEPQQHQMHAAARDLVAIATGRAALRFSSASAADNAAAAAAVAALEDAGGCGAQQHPAVRLFGRGITGFSSSSSLPLSRL